MDIALREADILLPAEGLSYEKWAVVACDQFTSQPDYWQAVEELVGDAPSALRLTLPEIYLGEADERIPAIHTAMDRCLDAGLLRQAVHGFVLVERTTAAGMRPGLVAALDLEAYDPAPGSRSLIRATEGTVPERVPPRARVRFGAALELPHVMMLIDDPAGSVIEPLWRDRSHLRPLYDFDLMLGGGHLRGWAVEGEQAGRVMGALEALAEGCDGLMYAVGDGNHSLAAAKQYWNAVRANLSAEERADHPARFALAELVNLNCDALVFEPIHRVVFGVNPVRLGAELRSFLRLNGIDDEPGSDLVLVGSDATLSFRSEQHPLPLLQRFLDDYLNEHPEASIDYIHGDDTVRRLVSGRPDVIGIMVRAFDKAELFGAIRRWGVLPRKTFSMGEAVEKRYYLEARRIRP